MVKSKWRVLEFYVQKRTECYQRCCLLLYEGLYYSQKARRSSSEHSVTQDVVCLAVMPFDQFPAKMDAREINQEILLCGIKWYLNTGLSGIPVLSRPDIPTSKKYQLVFECVHPYLNGFLVWSHNNKMTNMSPVLGWCLS